MRTISAKANEVKRNWWVIDAADQILGRVAAKAANLLRGKEKAIFTPHVDTGDFVVVINADKVRLSGKKETAKSYMSFSGYVGGHKSETVKARRARRPELLVEGAIKGMIPHTRLGRAQITKLKVYAGADWHERETWEMYGFWIDGHPHLVHLYLPGGFEGYPMRKDFPLLAREVKPWPGLTNVEPIAGSADEEEGA